MKVLSRYDKFDDGVTINGVSKTEPGLATPLSVLFERYSKGQEIPPINGMVNASIPYMPYFDNDISEQYKRFTALNNQMDSIRQKASAEA